MPQIDAANVTLALPLWAAGAVLVLLLVLAVVALRRSATSGSIAALFGIPALIVIGWAAWTSIDQGIVAQHRAERQALDARMAQLAASAVAPGSSLACLDAMAGREVEASCERALFASPQTAAAAAVYVEARLRLLADGLDYARRADRSYQAALVPLQLAAETDRFGFVAHVLAYRDGCTPQQCIAFALLHDATEVKAHMQAQTYDKTVARYAESWTEQGAANASAAGTPANAGLAVPTVVTKPIDFPSAASIPPVSIMNPEPPAGAKTTPSAPRTP